MQYGAWGVVAVLFVMIICLYWFMSKKHERQIKEMSTLLEKRNNQLVSLIQKCSNVISQAAHAIENSNQIILDTQEIIKESNEKNKNVETLVQKTEKLIDVCLFKQNG